ncbi:ribonuclease HI [Spirulina sp. CS-785/01]|uniref:ribonuclease HI n=1 Tax=Spirulina sp. CS-785/01 TaxID=3021716 RepID=UPI002330EC7D|nr:ribonuclease HI [Spirulina sp. CS-785/01]MDB9311638.1 ribonuclease HI [Spirulina sp. CS-785/01]
MTKSNQPIVTIYTDGACLGNPGVGGYAALLMYGEHQKEISGSEGTATTNNRMEMQAAIAGLQALKFPCQVKLYSDSQLLVNTMTKNWKRKANQDLWATLDQLVKEHQVEWFWVKGHADNPYNQRVDELAVAAAKAQRSIIK